MFERFTDTARRVLVQAQDDARRLGHHYIGSEHLLLAAAAVAAEAGEPASAVLRDYGVTPERAEAAILRTTGPCHEPGLDKDALASIGIDLDAVRARIEAAFGPDALTRPLPAASPDRPPTWRKGPLAGLTRRPRTPKPAGPRGNAPRDHIPLTPRARKALESSLREADALHDSAIGVQHITLALLALNDGRAPVILSALGAQGAPVRAAIIARYRKAS